MVGVGDVACFCRADAQGQFARVTANVGFKGGLAREIEVIAYWLFDAHLHVQSGEVEKTLIQIRIIIKSIIIIEYTIRTARVWRRVPQ